ncbi:ATP-binding protein [Nocardia sp. NPDC051030]|uniref:ATP-binding protein n=1 Tax=Nocardia sp. NPDC051030 TaxID=3155162 RepID=UPI003428B2B1
MNQDNAVVLIWVLAAALVVAVGAAGFAWWSARKQRARADALVREQRVRDEAVEKMIENLTGTIVPAIGEAVRRSDSESPTVALPTVLEQTRIAELVWRWAARCGDELRLVQVETRERVQREADTATGLAVAQATAAARAQAEAAAREATRAAVRAFGTSVVSLGADVSQVLSGSLRKHRGDEVYETLTRIDHSVQQMIRQAQSFVIVCGGLPGRRWPQQSLTDVVGGAVGRVRDYTRVRPAQLDRVVLSRVVEPLVHTIATLLDNALRYSPPTSFVDISFQEGHHGVTVIIDDAGVRMNAEQLDETRQILNGDQVVDIHQLGPSPRVGFPGVAALARRYGYTIYIDGPNTYGGMRAMVFIPDTLLAPITAPDFSSLAPLAPEPEVVEQLVAPQPVAEPAVLLAEPKQIMVEEPSPPDHDLTPGGLPKRRRRSAIAAAAPKVSEAESGSARPDIAAAWHSGSQRGRAAAIDHSKG